MGTKKLSALTTQNFRDVAASLTSERLSRYFEYAGGNENGVSEAVQLYILNMEVSSSLMCDIHWIEVVLRNKFGAELACLFGHEWFRNEAFLALLDKHTRKILLNVQQKVEKDLAKHSSVNRINITGKLIAELNFGFWVQLTDPKLEHTLWVPCLHKAFLPRKPPKRAFFSQQLERLRQLRNRVAHHEPVFHLDLGQFNGVMIEVLGLLCPDTALIMNKVSTVKRKVRVVNKYLNRQ